MSRLEGRAQSHGREVGVVVAVGPSGRLTVRSLGERFPPEGSRLVDRTGKVPGVVMRVFGPVARPYLSVRVGRPLRPLEAANLVGTRLVREEGERHGPR